MKKKIISAANVLFSWFGYRLIKNHPAVFFRSKHVHDPQYSRMEEPKYREELISGALGCGPAFF